MIREDLLAYLLAQSSITDLVDNRITLSRLVEGDPHPSIAFRRASGGHQHDLDGSAGYAAPVFEFAVIGNKPIEIEAVCEALRQELQGYRGAMGSTTIQRCTLDDESDDYIESKTGDDVGYHRTLLKYTIGYLESVPTF